MLILFTEIALGINSLAKFLMGNQWNFLDLFRISLLSWLMMVRNWRRYLFIFCFFYKLFLSQRMNLVNKHTPDPCSHRIS